MRSRIRPTLVATSNFGAIKYASQLEIIIASRIAKTIKYRACQK